MTELPDHLAVGVKIVQTQRKNHLRTGFYDSVLYLQTTIMDKSVETFLKKLTLSN